MTGSWLQVSTGRHRGMISTLVRTPLKEGKKRKRTLTKPNVSRMKEISETKKITKDQGNQELVL